MPLRWRHAFVPAPCPCIGAIPYLHSYVPAPCLCIAPCLTFTALYRRHAFVFAPRCLTFTALYRRHAFVLRHALPSQLCIGAMPLYWHHALPSQLCTGAMPLYWHHALPSQLCTGAMPLYCAMPYLHSFVSAPCLCIGA